MNIRKRIRKKIRKVCAGLTAAFLFCSVLQIPVYAGGKGSVTLRLSEKAQGIEVSLYMAAKRKNDKTLWTEMFADCGVSVNGEETSAEMMEKAEKLSEYARKNKIKGKKQTLEETEELIFEGLDQGIYLAVQTGGEKDLKMQPVLICVPMKNTEGKTEWNPVICPKFQESGRPDPNRPQAPDPHDFHEKNPVKTEDSTPLAGYVLLMTGAICVSAVLLYKRKQRKGA